MKLSDSGSCDQHGSGCALGQASVRCCSSDGGSAVVHIILGYLRKRAALTRAPKRFLGPCSMPHLSPPPKAQIQIQPNQWKPTACRGEVLHVPRAGSGRCRAWRKALLIQQSMQRLCLKDIRHSHSSEQG